MPKITAEPTWLAAPAKGTKGAVGVDRERRAILGYVVAQEGPFREWQPRGEFDRDGLKQIVALMKAKPKGTKSRFGHPSLSSDAVGTYLGRALNPRMGSVVVERDGGPVELAAVRADLYFSDSAGSKNPNGDLAEYLMSLAEEDPGAVGSSLVLRPEEKYRINAKGEPLTDEKGGRLPPLWYPLAIHASDLVDEGAAVDGLLSAGIDLDSLPEAVRLQGWAMLDKLFAGEEPAAVYLRCLDYLGRYLGSRYGTAPMMKDPLFAQGLASRLAPQPSGQEYLSIERLVAMGGKFYTMGSESWCDTPTDSYRLVFGHGFVKDNQDAAATPRLDALRNRLDRMALTARELRPKM